MIYIVEDDRNIQEIELFALKNSGYQAVGFETAKDFTKALSEKLPELILLDIMLPDEGRPFHPQEPAHPRGHAEDPRDSGDGQIHGDRQGEGEKRRRRGRLYRQAVRRDGDDCAREGASAPLRRGGGEPDDLWQRDARQRKAHGVCGRQAGGADL